MMLLLLAVTAAAWDIGRFARQAWFFNQPFAATPAPSGQLFPGTEWGPLDDVVMGGSSSSTIQDGRWRGTVIEKNGGFVGVRCRPMRPPIDASQYTGLRVRMSGDNLRLKFVVRDDEDWNGVAWTWIFDTAEEVLLPFKDAVPTRFARTVQTKPLDTSKLTVLQLALSKFEFDGKLNPKFKEGPFALDLISIELY
ncbi:hypothetical protein CTAYLR_000571 [Chrysophaeum taylorii]|uniref:NADH:ubiquinone oxidoreductase intermediate-associated protein 30 domain-containing protein n=1 Tax=Chrysophaeum taylorii TaxID=2483200 RepID=A0AAD7UHT3_9STRA|nr:hypothetical protein CTAYLR_000571 [Chrysophaeum taylorii]